MRKEDKRERPRNSDIFSKQKLIEMEKSDINRRMYDLERTASEEWNARFTNMPLDKFGGDYESAERYACERGGADVLIGELAFYSGLLQMLPTETPPKKRKTFFRIFEIFKAEKNK